MYAEYCERCNDFYTKGQDEGQEGQVVARDCGRTVLDEARRAWPEKDEARPRDLEEAGRGQEGSGGCGPEGQEGHGRKGYESQFNKKET